MTKPIAANASPEKHLFISLITRDITLIDAFLDLIDNSVNAILEPFSRELVSAEDYQRVLSDQNLHPAAKISIVIERDKITIEDNAQGIDTETASQEVFRFGRASHASGSSDRLSVYGIGLKRAMFKMANSIEMTSDHVNGGFELQLNVPQWERLPQAEWSFDIQPRPKVKAAKTGTRIILRELLDDVCRRIEDGVFFAELKKRIARTYSFFIGRLIDIELNGESVEPVAFSLGENFSSNRFSIGSVSCSVTAGLSLGDAAGNYAHDSAGWYVFCNGRAVVYADKTPLTGWGGGAGMPIFQPKHRPFVGIVFFVSPNPEELPWTTTKASVNEESQVWQEAKRVMVVVGKQVTKFLDRRYSSEGTDIKPADLKGVSGSPQDVLRASVGAEKVFREPTKAAPPETKVQYMAKKSHISSIANFLRRPNMSAADIGRHTFDFFLRNEVGVDE